MIAALRDFGIPEESIIKKVQEDYQLTREGLEKYLK